jgi:hypothetical protein
MEKPGHVSSIRIRKDVARRPMLHAVNKSFATLVGGEQVPRFGDLGIFLDVLE